MTEWITDRQPTEADGDGDGDVSCKRHPDGEGYQFIHWSHIGPGVPWRRTNYWQPPAQPEIRVGQIWRSRKGMNGTILTVNPHGSDNDVESDLYGGHWHNAQGHSCLGSGEHEDDLVELIADVPAAEIRVGQIWKRRDGVEVRIVKHDNPQFPFFVVPPDPGEPVSLCRRDGTDKHNDSDYDLITLVQDVPAAEPEPDPEPTPTIPAHLRVGAVPFYVLVVSDDSGGQAIVFEHEIPNNITIESVLQHQQNLADRYGTTYVAECRILPELTRHA